MSGGKAESAKEEANRQDEERGQHGACPQGTQHLGVFPWAWPAVMPFSPRDTVLARVWVCAYRVCARTQLCRLAITSRCYSSYGN